MFHKIPKIEKEKPNQKSGERINGGKRDGVSPSLDHCEGQFHEGVVQSLVFDPLFTQDYCGTQQDRAECREQAQPPE